MTKSEINKICELAEVIRDLLLNRGSIDKLSQHNLGAYKKTQDLRPYHKITESESVR